MLRLTMLFICFLVYECNTLSEGDICALETGESGVCNNVYKCPSAITLLRRKIRPPTCGFEGDVPIVCCKVDELDNKQQNAGERPVGQISLEKCKEYGKTVYKVIKPPILIGGLLNVSTCAQTAIPLIIGGKDANPAEFPHQALLGYGEDPIKWGCGGSLVSDQYVVTAAHCIRHKEYGFVHTVRLGELDYGQKYEEADPKDFTVVERIVSPLRELPLRYHDIALLKLDKIVTFNKYIRPICLHTAFEIPPTSNKSSIPRFIATGWGVTELGSPSERLKLTVIDMYDHTSCTQKYKNNRLLNRSIDDASQICAGGIKHGNDTCQGDSGGPLQIYRKDVYCMYSLIGVTSVGKACGMPGVPAIYTRVSYYTKWIEDIVWPQ